MIPPDDDGGEEDESVVGEGTEGWESIVESVEEHCEHDDIHCSPVAVPLYLQHPAPEIQIKSSLNFSIICFIKKKLFNPPNPDANTEVGQCNEEKDCIRNEETILKLLQPLEQFLIASDKIIIHLHFSVFK